MTTVFLSYARADDGEPYEPAGSFVARLYADLKGAGFDVWFDRVSMPSRSLTFHQEIRDAIAACERLVLVVGPHAVTSDYVTQEWQFAYFAANKCVVPIVRRDPPGAPGGALEALLPEDLKLLPAEDFRDDSRYGEHLATLVRQLSQRLPPVGKLVAVPELPPGYRAQPKRLRELRDMLLIDLRKPVVVTGAAARVGLQGMGGIGKSVLASALARHPDVQRAFRDDIFWISLGQTPQIEELQRRLARELGDDGLFTDRHTGKERLRLLLGQRATLLILDDVWEREHAEAFNVVGPLGRILLTTRDAGLVTSLAARENHYRVELPGDAEAEAILASAADVAPESLPRQARDIVSQCGRLPLALALCGGMARGAAGVSWQHVLEALRDHDLEFLSSDHPAEEQHRNAWVAMDVSLRALATEHRERFAELAVFDPEIGAPQEAIVTLWEHTGRMAPRDAAKLLAELGRRSLVQVVHPPDGEVAPTRLYLHDLLRNFAEGMAAKRFGSRAAFHRILLDAYGRKCPHGWPSGPDDGYFLRGLCRHLSAAEQIDAVVDLLTDIPWLEAKCRAGLVFDLEKDYREVFAVLPEMRASLRGDERRAARMARWTHDVVRHSRAWRERLDRAARGELVPEREPVPPAIPPTARMWTEEEIDEECRRIRDDPTRLDRLRGFAAFVRGECEPLIELGDRAGFVLQHALSYAPGGPVHRAAEQRLSACRAPLLVRRWPKETAWNPKPHLLRTLETPRLGFACVTVAPDGRQAISASHGNALWLWNLESGACVGRLEGHLAAVSSACMTPDGRLAVSGSNDGTVRVWDLARAACVRVLHGHGRDVASVSVSADGSTAVSSDDCQIRVWDLRRGVCLRRLDGRGSLSLLPDGRRAVSSDGWSLKVWRLEDGACLQTFDAHGTGSGVSVTPDGRRAVSACGDGVRVWDLERGIGLRTLEGHAGRVTSVSLSPDGRRAVSGAYDWTVRVWDVERGTCVRELQGHNAWVTAVSLTADGRRAVSGGDDGTIRVWDVESGACPPAAERLGYWVLAASVTPDGCRALSAGEEATVRVWNPESAACLRHLEGHGAAITSLSLTPDGHLAVSGSQDRTLGVWDLEGGAQLRTLEGHEKTVLRVSLLADGLRAVSGSEDKTLRLWDLETGACLRRLEGHGGLVSTVGATPDGRRVVSGSSDGTLRVWDLESGACLLTLEGIPEVRGLAVTAGGRRMVTVCDDATLRLWDLETGACLRNLSCGDDWITSLSVTPDGRRAVLGSVFKKVQVWNLETGSCEVVFPTTACVSTVAASRANVVFGTERGETLFAALHNLPEGPIATADGSDAAHERLLQRGLEHRRREKGPVHQETLAHLSALTRHLDRIGRSDEARALHDEHERVVAAIIG